MDPLGNSFQTKKKGPKRGCSDRSFSLGDGNHNDNSHYTCSTNNSVTNINRSNINDDDRSKNCNSCKFNCDVAEASRTRSTVSGMRLTAMICSSWRRASMLLGRWVWSFPRTVAVTTRNNRSFNGPFMKLSKTVTARGHDPSYGSFCCPCVPPNPTCALASTPCVFRGG